MPPSLYPPLPALSLLLVLASGVAAQEAGSVADGEGACTVPLLVARCRPLESAEGEGEAELMGSSSADGRTKVVHFVRHAEGHHNVAAAGFERGSAGYIAALSDFQFHDARLSQDGEAQCAALQTSSGALDFDVVLVSPLTRTLQTATLGLGLQRGVPFVALEPLRERFGRNPCDNRRSLGELQAEFPHVNFSLVESSNDPHPCSAHDCGERESLADVDARIHAYLSHIRDRSEGRIIVVGHSATFARMFEKHLFWDQDKYGPFRLKNAQVRSLILKFHPAHK